jgi:hypothetical protein
MRTGPRSRSSAELRSRSSHHAGVTPAPRRRCPDPRNASVVTASWFHVDRRVWSPLFDGELGDHSLSEELALSMLDDGRMPLSAATGGLRR